MSRILEAAEKEVIRREILSMCEMAAPNGADLRVLRASLAKSGYELAEAEIARQAAYLEGKGLVSIQTIENRALGISRRVVRITPMGTDWLEGSLTGVTGVD